MGYVIYNNKMIEKPNLQKIQDYIDYCEESKQEVYKKLREYSKDKEIQSLQNELNDLKNNALYVMTDKEKTSAMIFKNDHYKKCKNSGTYLYKLTGTGIGTAITIKCDKCEEELDITDTESW